MMIVTINGLRFGVAADGFNRHVDHKELGADHAERVLREQYGADELAAIHADALANETNTNTELDAIAEAATKIATAGWVGDGSGVGITVVALA